MEIGDLYQLVLILVLIGMIIGIGIISLDKFMASDAVTQSTGGATGTLATALNNSINAIADIPASWLTLIVTIAVLSIILVLVIRSFGKAR